jgi:hypothetical protein
VRVDKLRKPTKIIEDYLGREKEVKISKLCQYCPNETCEGFYRKDAPRACLTFRSWKNKKLSLEQAVAAKYKQNKRHERTDEFREAIYSILEEYTFDYETRRMAGSIAAILVKGATIDVVDKLGVTEEDKKKIMEILEKMNAEEHLDEFD